MYVNAGVLEYEMIMYISPFWNFIVLKQLSYLEIRICASVCVYHYLFIYFSTVVLYSNPNMCVTSIIMILLYSFVFLKVVLRRNLGLYIIFIILVLSVQRCKLV